MSNIHSSMIRSMDLLYWLVIISYIFLFDWSLLAISHLHIDGKESFK